MTTFRSETSRLLTTKRRWRTVVLSVAFVLLVLGGLAFVRARGFDGGSAVPPLNVGGKVMVKLPDKTQVPLQQLIQPGVPTVVNIWATWCGPCQKEMPRLAELRRQFGPRELNMVFLNVRDPGATAEDQAEFLNGVGLGEEKHAVLNENAIGPLTGADDILVPRTIVFDANGEALGRITGYKPLAISRIAGAVQ